MRRQAEVVVLYPRRADAACGVRRKSPFYTHAVLTLARDLRRKSPQWFGLRREAAQAVADDQDFLPLMREYCVAHRMIDNRRACCPEL